MSGREETIKLMPTLINRSPTVFKMMTFSELIFVILSSGLIGLIVGFLFWVMFQFSFVLILGFVLAFMIIGANLGGFVVSRLKRNKPETWLSRWIEFKLHSSRFITRDQLWSLKRSVRGLK